jgi:hypothetical protein
MDADDRRRPAGGRLRSGRAVLLLALCLCGPAAARAQSPFAPLPAQPTTTAAPVIPTTTTSTTATSTGGLSSTEQIALFAAGIVLIGGIAFLIRRDARSHTPAGRPQSDAPRATVPPRAKRVEQSRARAKAARRQRKRTRTRTRR